MMLYCDMCGEGYSDGEGMRELWFAGHTALVCSPSCQRTFEDQISEELHRRRIDPAGAVFADILRRMGATIVDVEASDD